MHSRVINIYNEKPEHLYEEQLFEYMAGVADYCVEEDGLDEVAYYLENFATVDGEDIVFDLDKIEKYLKEKYKYFLELVEDTSFDGFVDLHKNYLLKESIDDRFCLYFYTDYAGLVTKDYFLKMIYKRAKEKPEMLNWTFLQMFDYHF